MFGILGGFIALQKHSSSKNVKALTTTLHTRKWLNAVCRFPCMMRHACQNISGGTPQRSAIFLSCAACFYPDCVCRQHLGADDRSGSVLQSLQQLLGLSGLLQAAVAGAAAKAGQLAEHMPEEATRQAAAGPGWMAGERPRAAWGQIAEVTVVSNFIDDCRSSNGQTAAGRGRCSVRGVFLCVAESWPQPSQPCMTSEQSRPGQLTDYISAWLSGDQLHLKSVRS